MTDIERAFETWEREQQRRLQARSEIDAASGAKRFDLVIQEQIRQAEFDSWMRETAKTLFPAEVATQRGEQREREVVDELLNRQRALHLRDLARNLEQAPREERAQCEALLQRFHTLKCAEILATHGQERREGRLTARRDRIGLEASKEPGSERALPRSKIRARREAREAHERIVRAGRETSSTPAYRIDAPDIDRPFAKAAEPNPVKDGPAQIEDPREFETPSTPKLRPPILTPDGSVYETEFEREAKRETKRKTLSERREERSLRETFRDSANRGHDRTR